MAVEGMNCFLSVCLGCTWDLFAVLYAKHMGIYRCEFLGENSG